MQTVVNFYSQITFIVNNKINLENFIDICSEAGALAVSIEDNLADSLDEKPIYDSDNQIIGWDNSKVVVLLDNQSSIQDFIQKISQYTDIPNYTSEIIEDKDWVTLTQNQFEPIEIGEKLIITPSWYAQNYTNEKQKIILTLDPGAAFGTGSHATTNLCLQWLEQNITTQNESVLDYGCGSGILAIAAKKLGASQVIGIDIDEKSVELAIYNAKNNQADCQFFNAQTNIETKFDIVIANILSNPLKLLASLLVSKVNNNGYLVLSGILSRQVLELHQAYQPYLNLEVWQEQEGWVCMAGILT